MSTLHVENLKGLSSGGNANKIIVPSGQTLDASAGVLTPNAGHVIQHNFTFLPSGGAQNEVETASSSYVATNYSVSITPKFANSRILFLASINIKRTVNASQTYLDLLLKRSIAGGGFGAVDGSGATNDMVRYRSSGSLDYATMSLMVPDLPNTTSAVTYTVFVRNSTNSNSNVMRVGENGSDEYCHVMEIKQ